MADKTYYDIAEQLKKLDSKPTTLVIRMDDGNYIELGNVKSFSINEITYEIQLKLEHDGIWRSFTDYEKIN